MAVKLRLRRMGRTKRPLYGLVATDSRSPRDGRYIEDLGRYEPLSEPATFSLDEDRVMYWLGQGAQPSDTVKNLLSRKGLMLRLHMQRKGKTEEEITAAVEAHQGRLAEKGEQLKVTPNQRRREALDAERERAAEARKLREAEAKAREEELQKEREAAEAAARAEAEQKKKDAEAAAAQNAKVAAQADGADVVDAQATPEASEEPAPDAKTEMLPGDQAAGTTEADVPANAPDSAEEQPAVEDASSDQVAADAGAEVAGQADAGAQEGNEDADEKA